MPRAARTYVPAEQETTDLLHKVLLVGDQNTGKTSLALRWVHNTFRPQSKATIGVDFHLKMVQHNANTNITVQLWDVSGQERFNQMTRAYYSGAVGAVVTFDLSRSDSLEGAMAWKADIEKKCFLLDGTPIPVILVGTKSDLPASPVRTEEEMATWCAEQKFLGYYPTSSRTGDGVQAAFTDLINRTAANDLDMRAREAETARVPAAQAPSAAPRAEQVQLSAESIPAAGSRPLGGEPFISVTEKVSPKGTIHLHVRNTHADAKRKRNRRCFGLFAA